MAYATPSDFLSRYDARTTGDLVGDIDQRLSPTQLLTNANLITALSNASGQMNSAALFSERYTVQQLQALTGDDLAFLVGLTCDLAFGRLNVRRGNDPKKLPTYQEALELLDMLRKGSEIFNVPGIQGVQASEFPSYSTYQNVNLLRDATLSRFFPIRRQQFPTSGGANAGVN